MPNSALSAALALASAPTLAPIMRRQPLPDGVHELLCIFARREDVILALMDEVDLDRLAFTACVDNYIQKVVLHSTGDPYRLLAGAASSSRTQLRGHMKLLLEGLHPDKAGASWKTSYAPRVIEAWRSVSSGQTVARAAPRASLRRATPQIPWIPRPVPQRRGLLLLPITALAILATAAALALHWREVQASFSAIAASIAP